MNLFYLLAFQLAQLFPLLISLALLALLPFLLSIASSAFDYSDHFQNQYAKRLR